MLDIIIGASIAINFATGVLFGLLMINWWGYYSTKVKIKLFLVGLIPIVGLFVMLYENFFDDNDMDKFNWFKERVEQKERTIYVDAILHSSDTGVDNPSDHASDPEKAEDEGEDSHLR